LSDNNLNNKAGAEKCHSPPGKTIGITIPRRSRKAGKLVHLMRRDALAADLPEADPPGLQRTGAEENSATEMRECQAHASILAKSPALLERGT